MALPVGEGTVPVSPDFKSTNFQRKVQQEGERASNGMVKSFGSAFKSIALTGGAVLLGGGLLAGLSKGIAEARDAQKIGRLTEQVIKTTGGAAKVSAKQVGDLAESLSNKTAVDDEVIQSGANLLLTFKNVANQAGAGNKIFDRTVAVANDMSVALGQDMKSSSIQLGKALNDPIKGVSALQRVGVSFTESQKEQIKTLTESGDLLGAQKVILKEVGDQFGGAAKAAADPVEQLKVVWGNLLEDLGTRALPLVESLASGLGDRLPSMVDAAAAAFAWLSEKTRAVWQNLLNVADTLSPLADGFQRLAGIGAKAFGWIVDFFKSDPGPAFAALSVIVGTFLVPAFISWATAAWAAAVPMIAIYAPVLAGAAAVAVLVGGIVYAYQHFEVFRNVVDTVVDVLRTGLGVAVRFVVDLWNNYLLPGGKAVVSFFVDTLWPAIQKTWAGIVTVITAAWNNVIKPVFDILRWYVEEVLVRAFKAWWYVVSNVVIPLVMASVREAWEFLRPVFSTLTHTVSVVMTAAFNAFGWVVEQVWNRVTGAVKVAWAIIEPVLSATVGFVAQRLTPVWEGMRAAAAAAWSALPSLIQGALRTVGGIIAAFLNSTASIADVIGLDHIAGVLRNGARSAQGWGQQAAQGEGGLRRRFGGPIPGSGRGDHVPILAEPGEFMIRRDRVKEYGRPFMEAFNNGTLGFRTGGLIPNPIDVVRGLADGVVDKARGLGTAALERVWPQLATNGDVFAGGQGGAFAAGAANSLRAEAFKLIRGEEAKMSNLTGGGFSKTGGGGPAGRYTAGMLRAKELVSARFPGLAWGGYANRNIAGTGTKSQHALWRAWDTMVGLGNVAKGNAIANLLLSNASSIGLKGLIWNGQKNFGKGWQPYGHPGGGRSATLQHRDHVHSEYFDNGGVLSPGWNSVYNGLGVDEHLVPATANKLADVIHIERQEDVDLFWQRARFNGLIGAL